MTDYDLKEENEHNSYVLEELEEELKVTEQLLAERQRVLDAIPECPEHGANCVPHAIEWIEKMKKIEASIIIA